MAKCKWPQLKHAVFGHLGDGNIHIIACIDSDDPAQRFEFDETLYRCLTPFGSSISAEHGMGTEKKPFLHYSRGENEIALMRTLKQALDPKGILSHLTPIQSISLNSNQSKFDNKFWLLSRTRQSRNFEYNMPHSFVVTAD